MDRLSLIRADLPFTCRYERFPEPTAETDTLFKYARWLEKNNLLKQDPALYSEVERLYRIAAENGHAKANVNLLNGSMRSRKYQLAGEESLRLSQQLIDVGVASGYYFIGIFLRQGSAGLQEDQEVALRYYRKAADEGCAHAQAYVARKLAPSNMAPDIAQQMRRCAAEQGEGAAASELGISLQERKQYREALEAYQLGVAAGDESSASLLYKGFRGPSPHSELYFLDQQKDLERANRYKAIWRMLARYSYASPKVPEINEIAPLPPAQLLPWDGKLQWLEDREANLPPPRPSEALIETLAKAKQLNPATGRPLPESPNFVRQTPNLFCESDHPCPQAGYWAAVSILSKEVRYFSRGEILPRCWGKGVESRIWPLPNKLVDRQVRVKWAWVGAA